MYQGTYIVEHEEGLLNPLPSTTFPKPTHRSRTIPTDTRVFYETAQKLFKKSLKMPLVVPGVTNQSGDKTEEWMNKLAGKQLHDGDETNETVSLQKSEPCSDIKVSVD